MFSVIWKIPKCTPTAVFICLLYICPSQNFLILFFSFSINNRSEKKEDVTPHQDPTPSASGDKVTNDSNVDKKPLSNLPSESTQSSTNQSSLPLMAMSPSNNTVPPLSQSSQVIKLLVLLFTVGLIVR